jgi:hypothetical protein
MDNARAGALAFHCFCHELRIDFIEAFHYYGTCLLLSIKTFLDATTSLMKRTWFTLRPEKTLGQADGPETPAVVPVRVLSRSAPGMPSLRQKEKNHASGPR